MTMDSRPVLLIGLSVLPTPADLAALMRQLEAELPAYRPVLVENLTGAVVLPSSPAEGRRVNPNT